MRAANRCKEHFQGDRCRKVRHHSSPVGLKPDPLHAGSFTAWEGEGDSKTVVKQAPGTRLAGKRNRRVNQILRTYTAKKFNANLMHSSERKTGSALLQLALDFFRRGRS